MRNIQKVIDLRFGRDLPIELAKESTKIAEFVRNEYTDYIGALIKSNKLHGLGWLISVTCRNPYQTAVYDNLSKLRLLDFCLKKNYEIDTVIVDNKGLFHSAKDICKKYGVKTTVQLISTNKKGRMIKLIYRIPFLVYTIIFSYLIPTFFCGKKIKPNNEIIYLDTFIKGSDFDSNGTFIDRFYPGFLQNLSDEDSSRLWYAPIIYSSENPLGLKRIIDNAKRADQNFLIMEEWLCMADYIYAFVYSFILPFKLKTIPNYLGVDVSKIIYQECHGDILSSGLFNAILRFRFIRRLYLNGIEFKKVIDWNENQIVDRALNIAVRKYYPAIPVIGYQGFIVSEHYVSHEPACYENDAKTIPDKLCVLLPALIDRKKRYCADLNVDVAPAFRLQSLLDYTPDDAIEKNLILLALPIQLDVSRMIIRLCAQLCDSLGLTYAVKLHPAISENEFYSAVPEVKNSKFQIVCENIYQLFPRTALLISSDSSVCFEAVYCGVGVVIIGNTSGPTSNPLKGIVDSKYWKVCYSVNCIHEVLNSKMQKFSPTIESELMLITKESVTEFMSM